MRFTRDCVTDCRPATQKQPEIKQDTDLDLRSVFHRVEAQRLRKDSFGFILRMDDEDGIREDLDDPDAVSRQLLTPQLNDATQRAR
jgi:hypothetical protein